MADLLQFLAILDSDPDDVNVLAALADSATRGFDSGGAQALGTAKKSLRERGRHDVALRLLDVELAATNGPRRADLLVEKGQLLDEELLDEPAAARCFEEALGVRPDDETAAEALQQMALNRANENWRKFAAKFVDEAKASTDRKLTTGLYLAAAENWARYAPGSAEIEQYLRRSLDADPHNRKAALHLERLLRAGARWVELAALLDARVDAGSSKDERIAALLGLVEICHSYLGQPDRALEHGKKVLAMDPAQPRVLRLLGDAFEQTQNWQALVTLYSGALKAKGDAGELGLVIQVGMILWKRLGDVEGAEDYFKRIRKHDPAHPAALDFYRAYHSSRGEAQKLVAILRQAEKALPPPGTSPAADARARALALEIAEVSEVQLATPEKAIDAWKQLLRSDPSSTEAKEALKRLYRKAEKWNPLLDLLKDEIERLPDSDVRGKADRLYEVVAIYRDNLRQDPMVLNTYNAILKLDPDDRRAIDELADKYRAMGRWQDLIGVLAKKAELASAPIADRAAILRETADLWIDRFGNYAQAIRPLERLLELALPDPAVVADAVSRLKDIYTRRRQWRQLIGLLGREADAAHGDDRRHKLSEMARLAAERVGDTRLSIEIHNRVVAEHADGGDDETLAALANLYEREKRWLALAEILGRQRRRAKAPAEAVALLEKQGALLADRVGAPAQAADAFADILSLDPGHGKALRTLRELYAAASDWDGLERLYGGLNQWDELCDALVGLGDRQDDRGPRLALFRRAAAIAERKGSGDRIARTWERVLAVEANDLAAARALAPFYQKAEKWSKLLPVLEVALAHAETPADKLARMSEIRTLCEHKLGSKALALTWTGRAFDLAPDDATVLGDLLRMAHLPEHWREVAAILARHAHDAARPSDIRLRLLRALSDLYGVKLGDLDAAREVHGKILVLTPKDAEAAAAYEELSERLSDWPALLASLRRRLDEASAPAQRSERRALLARIAGLEEERLADLDDAAATWQRVLADAPDDVAALAALSRLHGARGDWDALAAVLTTQLAAPGQVDDRRGLLMQLGALEEKNLERPQAALEHYLGALLLCRVPGPTGTVDACARFLDPAGPGGAGITPQLRLDVARALRPHLESAGDPSVLARCLEIITGSEPAGSELALELDRRLVGLHHGLGKPERAWDAAARVVAGDPADVDARAALTGLAHELGRTKDLAIRLGAALAARKLAAAPPAEVRALAAELALLYANDLGDRAGAEKAWIAVLDAEPDDAEAFDELAAIYRAASRWGDLRALLEGRVTATADDAARKVALLELAQLDEEILGDPGRAVGDYRRVLEVDPAHVPAYKALERLYAEGQSWRELDDVLALEVDHVPAKDQVGLVFRRAELHARQLAEPAEAVELLEDVVTMQPGHADGRELLEELLGAPVQRQRVARLLEPLYERDQLWKDLCVVLRVQGEATTEPVVVVELLARIATIEETHLENGRQAFETWGQALAADPADERPRTALVRLASIYDRWGDTAAALDKAAAATTDVAVAVPILRQLAEICDLSLGDNLRAIAAYQRLYQVDPTEPEVAGPALAALARLYEEDERWRDLRDTLRRQAEATTTPETRKALYARVAGLEEVRLDDRAQATATWRDVLSEDPDDPDALAALERLYELGTQWTELGDIVRHQVDLTTDVSAKIAQLFRLVPLHEGKRQSPADAVIVLLEILDLDGDDARALDELARLHRGAGRYLELQEVLERRLVIAEALAEPEAMARRHELAQLLAGPLGRELDALDHWALVLAREPAHEGALAAVKRALDDPNLGSRGAAILEPLYEATGQDLALCALLQTTAAREVGSEKVRRLMRVAHIRERRLADQAGALDATVTALRAAVAEPELPDLLGEVERLAADLGREGDLIDIYRGVADDVMVADLQRRLYLDIADLALAVRDDASLARTFYQKVLDGQPDDNRALGALEGLYRRGGDVRSLYEILTRKAELVTDPNDKLAALGELAMLAAGPVDRPDDAIAAWEQVLELDPSRADAVAALDQLYRRERRWPDVVDLYERRMGFAVTIDEAVGLRIRLAEVQERELNDLGTAVDSYAAALGGDPGNAPALAALERLVVDQSADPSVRSAAAEVLEPIYIARQDWTRLARLNEAQLESSAEPGERLALTRQIARLYEEQLEDLDGAFRWHARVFREDATDATVRDQLQRLATILDDWPGLAAVYQALLDDEPGDAPHLRDIGVAAATIYDRRLDAWELGAKAYRRVLASPGDSRDDLVLFGRLEELLTRHGQWPSLVEIYADGVDAADTGSDGDARRRELHARKAVIAESRLSDVEGAIAAWRAVIELADGAEARGDYERAAGQLDRLLRAAARWYDVAELLTDRLERAADERDEVERRLALAAVLEHELKDVTGAIDQYEEILGTAYLEQSLPQLERLITALEHRERIAGLLEPVYRARDWWQKLVVILDAKLAYVDDPTEKVALFLEIADLHDARGGDPHLSFEALAKAWQIEPSRRDVFDRLCAQGGRLGAWDDLVTTLEAGAAATLEPEVGAVALARIAEIHETHRRDHAGAIAAWTKVLAINSDDALALSSLDRLFAVESRAADLVAIVERRAELADDAGVRLVLLHRVASLYEEVLERPREAVVAYKNVLGVDDSDESSLDALERLYRELKEPRELAQILERKLELVRDPLTARQLHLDLATVNEQDLGDAYEAQNQLQAVLSVDPGDPLALAELDRLYQTTRMWPELLEVLDRRAVVAADAAARAELAFRAAVLTLRELVEPDAAIPRFGAVLAMAPGHAGARAALEELLGKDDHVDAVAAILDRQLRASGDHDALVKVTERRLELRGDPEARRGLWAALADIHETLRNDLKMASATWARALTEDPGDVALFGPLERLAQARGSWAELAGLLEKRLDAAGGGAIDGELEHTYALRLGRIYEDALADFSRAAVAYRRAADTHVDERGSLAALDRVLWRLGRWGELADVLAREADAAEGDAQAADLMFRLGDVREGQLRDLHGAVDAYRLVVERQSRHGAARASLERLLGTADAERSTIIETLEPLYESESDWGRLADLLAAKLAVTADHHERAAIYQRIAALAESRLGDGVRALDAVGGWLAEDPTSGEALGELDRLAAAQGRWIEVAARVQGVAQHAEDVALPLWIYLGTVQLDRLGDAAGAAQSFAAALAVDDEHAPALEALERIHRSRGDVGALAQVQARRAELAFDPPRKQALWTEVADLRERLGDTEGAIAAWEAVIDIADDDRMPLGRLAAIHERRGDKRALVTTLGRAARIAADPGEEKSLRVRIATLESAVDSGADVGAAAAAWQAVLDLDPTDGAALTALEEVHAKAGDWMSVQDVLTRKLELARSSTDKTLVLARMARVAERERGAIDDAIGHWYAALEADNAQVAGYSELERLLGKSERWHDLVELLERRADLHGTLGDGEAELGALARAADIWEGPLDDPDAAGEILEKILRREPGSVAALTRLAKIHERAGDWDKCGDVLQRALKLGPRGQDAADLFFRLGEVADKASHDRDTAIAHYRQALVHDAAHPAAVAALEKLARDGGDWVTVGDMLGRRLAAVERGGDGDLLGLALELAEVKRRTGDPAAALPVLEKAAAAAPGDVRVLAPLADLYFAAGQHEQAAPIYARLAEDAKAGRRMKDVARYRQRQGGILEARGDAAGALAAYEEAFRVNPTDVPTMAGLGRLYMAAKDWEKSRRVYRSLVLQNLSPDVGVTKPDVYLALGHIHVELGERPQAKGMFQRGLEIEPQHQGLKDAIATLG